MQPRRIPGLLLLALVVGGFGHVPVATAQPMPVDPVEERSSTQPLRNSSAGKNGLVAGWVAESESSSRLLLVDPGTGEATGVPSGSRQLAGGYELEWTPDGTLLSTIDRDAATTAFELVTIDPFSGVVRTIYQLPSSVGQELRDFSWSPDGDRIAVTYYPGGVSGQLRIGVIDIATATLQDVTEGSFVDWSPAGDRLTFIGPDEVEGQYGNSGDLWVSDVDGTDAQNISRSDASIMFPDWSPDGERIVASVASKPLDGFFYGIRLFDAESGTSEKISVLSGHHTWTTWSPDGRSILYNYFDVHAPQFPPETVVKTLGTNGARPIYTGALGSPVWQTEPGCLLDPDGRPARLRADGDGEVEVGDWVALGCFTKAGKRFRTRDPLLVSGLTLTPRDSAVLIDTDTRRLTSTGPVEVTVEGRAAGVKVGPIKLFTGRLDWGLGPSSRQRFAIEHFLDLPVSKDLVVKPTSDGRARLSVHLGLPQLLGALELDASDFNLSNTAGLETDKLEVRLPTAIPVTDFARLQNSRVSYDPAERKWEVAATVESSGVSADVGFRYDKGVLREAHVLLPAVDVAGMFRLTDVAVRYDRTRSEQKQERETYTLAASAPVGDDGDADRFEGVLRYADGELDGVNVSAGTARFFGVIRVSGLSLAWSKEDGWSGGAAAVLRPGDLRTELSVELRSVKHRIVGGAFAAPVLGLGPPGAGFQVEFVELSFSEGAAPGGGVQTTWSGGGKVRLPGPGAPAVGASLTFVDGQFRAGSVEADSVPLGPGIKLGMLKLALALEPLALSGTTVLQLGPELPYIGAATASATASFRQAARPGDPDVYSFSGDVRIGNGLLTRGTVTYLTSGLLVASGGFEWSLGDLRVADAAVDGTFDEKGYRIAGNASVGMGQARLPGRVRVTKAGIAACIGLPGTALAIGFGYRWNGKVTRLESACDLDVFVRPPSSRVRHRDSTTRIVVPSGVEATVFELTGQGGALTGVLTGPDGTSIDLDAADGFQGDHFLYRESGTTTTYVAVSRPAEGPWTVDPQGGPDLELLRTAVPLPDPNLEVSVLDDGSTYRLQHSLTPSAGLEVVLAEVVGGGEHVLLTTTAASGSKQFEPSPGPAGPRVIVATVLQDGLVRSIAEVTSYEAPLTTGCVADHRCNTTLSAKVASTRRRLVVSGRLSPDAAPGPVVVSLSRRGQAVATRTAEERTDGFRVVLPRRRHRVACQVTVTFPGSDGYLPAQRTLRARC